MARQGINRETGEVLTGWAHCAQSIIVILTTALGTRVMRRDFGSDVPGLIDRPINSKTAMDYYMAVSVALKKWEPAFHLARVQMLAADASGMVSFQLDGVFYPNGHRGDFSKSESQSMVVGLENAA